MHLYNLALVAPSNITAACVGQFSGTRTQEIAVCRAGARIELLRPDTTTGRAASICEQQAFGTVRSMANFRLTGGSKGECCGASAHGRSVAQRGIELQVKATRRQHSEALSFSLLLLPAWSDASRRATGTRLAAKS